MATDVGNAAIVELNNLENGDFVADAIVSDSPLICINSEVVEELAVTPLLSLDDSKLKNSNLDVVREGEPIQGVRAEDGAPDLKMELQNVEVTAAISNPGQATEMSSKENLQPKNIVNHHPQENQAPKKRKSTEASENFPGSMEDSMRLFLSGSSLSLVSSPKIEEKPLRTEESPIAEADSWNSKIRLAILDLSSSQQALMNDLENSATNATGKLNAEERKAREARRKAAQAELALKKAEEAVRAAQIAKRRHETAAIRSESEALSLKHESNESLIRLAELKNACEEEQKIVLGSLVVQKGNVAMAFKDLQEKAESMADLESMEDLESDEGIVCVQNKLKSLNRSWFRFTIERRKFQEAVKATKSNQT